MKEIKNLLVIKIRLYEKTKGNGTAKPMLQKSLYV